MSRSFLPVILVLLLLAAASPARAQQDLAAARDLYTAAKYEEALAVLDRAKPATPETALGIEQYRAMCLLALDRKADAEKAIEAVADLDPFYQPAEDDAAPWVRAAFRETRRKVLPSALQRLYGHAKDAYTKKEMTEAVAAFGRVLKILDDPDLTLDSAARGDMKMVAQGFLDLAQAAAAPPPAPAPAVQLAPSTETPTPAAAGATTNAARTAAPPPSSPSASPSSANRPPANAAAVPPAGTPGTSDRPIFDASSPDVVPPLPIRRDVPRWAYGPRAAPGTTVVIEVVVRETGSIESAVVRESAGKYYDEMVAQAARNWLYRPALKAGQPVRYRLLIKVVISGAPEPDASGR